MAKERLQKILSRSGYGSRRSCERLIENGRVILNGKVASLGDKANTHQDRIVVDGTLIAGIEPLVYIALYKPRGVISAVSSPDDRPTVRELIDVEGFMYPVGRLDVDSEGLILLTNDGGLTNRLTHPRYGHEKEYRVLIVRKPDEKQLENWRRGIVLSDGSRTAKAQVSVEAVTRRGTWIHVVVREGKKRQIRETGTRLGLPVHKVIRVRIGTLKLGNLKPREWRYLSSQDIASLKKLTSMV